MKKRITQTKKQAEEAEKSKVRPHVKKIIERLLKENAPTWKELAKR